MGTSALHEPPHSDVCRRRDAGQAAPQHPARPALRQPAHTATIIPPLRSKIPHHNLKRTALDHQIPFAPHLTPPCLYLIVSYLIVSCLVLCPSWRAHVPARPEPQPTAMGRVQDILRRVKAKFDSADTDGTGQLHPQEFIKAFLGGWVGQGNSGATAKSILQTEDGGDAEALAKLFMRIDADSDGTINWDEFSTYMLLESQGSARVREFESTVTMQDPVPSPVSDLLAHKDAITHITAMKLANGVDRYATCGRDGTVRLWNAKDLKHVKTLHLPRPRIALAARDGTERLSSARASRSVHSGGLWATCSAFMPLTQKLAVGSFSRSIRIYDLASYEIAGQIPEIDFVPLCLDVWVPPRAKDSELVVVGDGGGWVRLFEVRSSAVAGGGTDGDAVAAAPGGSGGSSVERLTERPRWRFQHHKDWVMSVKHVPTGKLRYRFLQCHGDKRITSLAFDAAKRRLITGAEDGDCKIWNFSSGACLSHLVSKTKAEVTALVPLRGPLTRYVLAAGWDRCITFYEDNNAKSVGPSRSLAGHKADILAMVALEGSSTVVTASDDGELWVWNMDSCAPKRRMQAPGTASRPANERAVEALAFLAAGATGASAGGGGGGRLRGVLVAVGADRWLRLWDVLDGTMLAERFTGHRQVWDMSRYTGGVLSQAAAAAVIREERDTWIMEASRIIPRSDPAAYGNTSTNGVQPTASSDSSPIRGGGSGGAAAAALEALAGRASLPHARTITASLGSAKSIAAGPAAFSGTGGSAAAAAAAAAAATAAAAAATAGGSSGGAPTATPAIGHTTSGRMLLRPDSAPPEIALVCSASIAARLERRISVKRMMSKTRMAGPDGGGGGGGDDPSSAGAEGHAALKEPTRSTGSAFASSGFQNSIAVNSDEEGGREDEDEDVDVSSASSSDDHSSDTEVPTALWLSEFEAARHRRLMLATQQREAGGGGGGSGSRVYGASGRIGVAHLLKVAELSTVQERPGSSFMSSRKGVATAAGVISQPSGSPTRPGAPTATAMMTGSAARHML
ncbi:hypothetical protein VOLCADRAFT_96020 [Volvox carteri f. nagariensis]|uniref:EF-hand domain-containing protein n=1 Tax=Volvox carteri f. nagariensis TaxID=3068 RepID=D8U900_VOLCA|nr:uncharacterized protein VOLCADRAFT_96020 [Volvox carteri f. nagariensis]EFJ43836.1 hypothetical protein VOLCADRAFT_96020 [Volvox carteri f. nagariensis]|eukprot:XP_002955082.1 hypothetical protein VOLCADRAFT_96020 [Volvox carteri f. nagariensis]